MQFWDIDGNNWKLTCRVQFEREKNVRKENFNWAFKTRFLCFEKIEWTPWICKQNFWVLYNLGIDAQRLVDELHINFSKIKAGVVVRRTKKTCIKKATKNVSQNFVHLKNVSVFENLFFDASFLYYIYYIFILYLLQRQAMYFIW